MELQDKELISIQEVRNLLQSAYEAQKQLAAMNQEQIDRIVAAISQAGIQNAEKLAKMAHEETGFGKWQDKIVKNIFAAKMVYEAIKDQKTVGMIRDDRASKVMDFGIPVGVVAGIIPSTNPTSTVIYKAMIAVKGGNGIVISPHPSAKKCILETVKVIAQAAERAGCPKGAIGVITVPTLAATQELMKHDKTALILATGGAAMVKAAYSSGNPAIGVGAGNGPAFIDKSANVELAVQRIVDSKTFDYGTICASEQSIIIEKCMEEKVAAQLTSRGAYMLSGEESKQLGRFILRANGTMNPQIVGKSAWQISQLAGLSGVPKEAALLVARETGVGMEAVYSHEKLAPILALYVEENVDKILEKSVAILEFEGIGHTFTMHAEDDALVKRFAKRIPASRILVNTPGALGGIGASANLFPALTLGCGAMGGSSSSNNIGPMDLINIKRVAYGVRELEEIRRDIPASGPEVTGACGSDEMQQYVERIVKGVLQKLTGSASE